MNLNMSTINPNEVIHIIAKRTVSTAISNSTQSQISSSKRIILSNKDLIPKQSYVQELHHNKNTLRSKPQTRSHSYNLLNEFNNDIPKKIVITRREKIVKTPHQTIIHQLLAFKKSIVTPYAMVSVITQQLPKDQLLICNLQIKKIIINDVIIKTFVLSLNHNERIILNAHCKKKLRNISYKIFINDQQDYSIGKVKSNFLRTEFKIYDNPHFASILKTNQKKEVGCIKYDCTLFRKTKSIQNMHVFLPRPFSKLGGSMMLIHSHVENTSILDNTSKVNIIQNTSNNLNMTKVIERFKTQIDQKSHHEEGNMIVMKNDMPKWSEKNLTYYMNFNGRVDKPSPSNFTLTLNEKTILRFGKVNDNQYSMDFQHPLSPLQAIGICLSTLTSKILCD